jgi:hypothetical protein
VVEWGGFDGNDLSLATNKANARRIVECVNPLEGIPNPAAIADVVAALERIAACESFHSGDLVDIARQALASLRGEA